MSYHYFLVVRFFCMNFGFHSAHAAKRYLMFQFTAIKTFTVVVRRIIIKGKALL